MSAQPDPPPAPTRDADLTLGEVARQLGFFVWQLERLLSARLLPGYWQGGTWLVRSGSLPLVRQVLHDRGYVRMHK